MANPTRMTFSETSPVNKLYIVPRFFKTTSVKKKPQEFSMLQSLRPRADTFVWVIQLLPFPPGTGDTTLLFRPVKQQVTGEGQVRATAAEAEQTFGFQ